MNRDVCEHFNPVDLPCGKCKPEALRLADAIDPRNEDELFWRDREAAAAELRRLHASCEDYAQHKQRQDQRILKLYAQRDALLETLKTVEWHGQGSCWVVDADKIDAAIKAAEENA